MIPKIYTTFLILENGQVFQGQSFNQLPVSCGEIVFNTGMTGYQEVITDPSYCGQILLFTYPEIGNTGVNSIDLESNFSHITGLIARSICFNPSNWQAESSLPNYLIEHRIPHIFGLDTRYLAKQLRKAGVMTAYISTENFDKAQLRIITFKQSQDLGLVDRVTTHRPYRWLYSALLNCLSGDYLNISRNTCFRDLNVVVIDYGVKFNILNRLLAHGCNPIVMPAHASYQDIAARRPDGLLLSNGPGDPASISYAIKNIQKILMLNIPVFGICLGHQLLSLAIGSQTNKLKFGHRGLNHPSGMHSMAKITSQNHGYVVESTALYKKDIIVTCINLNDETISGLAHKFKPCFSVQYHPEASPGPHDSDHLFSHFASVMLSCKTKLIS